MIATNTQTNFVRPASKGMVSAEGASAAAQQGGDGFSAIFELMAQMMMAGNADAGADLGAGVSGGLLLPGFGNQQQETEEDSTAAMELAGMLLQMPQAADFFRMEDAAAQQFVSGLGLPAEAQQFLLGVRSELQAVSLKESAPKQAGNSEAGKQQAQAMQEESSGVKDLPMEAKVVSANTSGEQKSDLSQLDTFAKAVREAKKLISGTAKSEKADTAVDVDKLQSAVSANKFAIPTDTAVQKLSAPLQQEVPLPQQIKEGVSENLLKGEREFTIKLKPEGLGEITVKLMEKPGEAATLTLITAGAETAKLINSELNALRNAMRPMQIQVQEAVPQAPQTQQSGSHPDFSSMQQNMFNQQHRGQGQGSHSHSRAPQDAWQEEEGFQQEVADMAEGLNSYI